MQFRFPAFAFALAVCFSTMSSADVGDNVGEPTGAKISEKAGETGSGGDFTYRVDLQVPAFRGLEPELALTYSSSRISRDDVSAFAGLGWRLDGLSVIKRKSLGDGVPSYEDGADLYEIDGRDLMACPDLIPGTTQNNPNPWTRNYPLRFIAERPSSSCQQGGNLTAQVEDYTRYDFNVGQNKFVVTRRDGVRFEYTSLGDIVGDASAAGSAERRFAYNSYWLLTSISDTQRDEEVAPAIPVNVVNISYDHAGLTNGYAYRPKEIVYEGYRVVFGYEAQSSPLAQFPTSTTNIGKQSHLLRSVMVYDGTSKIRAYGLNYGTSPLLGTRLLSSVQQLGSDFVAQAGVITSGTGLPASTFEYAADAFSFQEIIYSGVEFHETGLVYDRDSDGKDDLVLFPWQTYKIECQGRECNNEIVTVERSYSGKRLSWGTDRALARNLPNVVKCAPSGSPLATGPMPPAENDAGTYVEHDRSGSTSSSLCIKSVHLEYVQNSGDGSTSYPVTRMQLLDFEKQFIPIQDYSTDGATTLSESYASKYEFRPVNLDLDPAPELIRANAVREVSGQAFGPGYSSPGSMYFQIGQDGFLADFTGDGVTDTTWDAKLWITRPEAGAGFPAGSAFFQTMAEAEIPGRRAQGSILSVDQHRDMSFQGIGDLNGDGISDVTYWVHNNSASDQLWVSYGTGRGFRPGVFVNLNYNLSIMARLPYGAQGPRVRGHRSEISDLNSDGLNDLIIHDGFSESGAAFSSKSSWVFLNKGDSQFEWVPLSGQLATGTTLPGFDGLVFVGDFDGNGLMDIVREGVDGRVLYGTGQVPSRMTAVNSTLGGRIEVAYTPSSAFGENRSPFVQQLVTSITTKDNRGGVTTTTFGYAGGSYDFLAREPLGYETVTTTLPAIAGETEGTRIVRTYLVDSLATAGMLKREDRLSATGALLSRRENFFETALDTNGPHMARVIETRETTRSSLLFEVTSTREFNAFGLVTSEKSLGFTNSGVDIDPADNRTTTTTYSYNAAGFIFDRPRVKKSLSGPDGAETWLAEQRFYYDDSALGALTEGNLTKVMEFNPGVSPPSRTASSWTHDEYGNVLSETDALGNTANYSYDTVKNLFRVSTTNPLGHVSSTTWNMRCQLPATETDLNGQNTVHTQDGFCREIKVTYPGEQVVETAYKDLGSSTAQHVRKASLGASTSPSFAKKVTWEYFDGLGRAYKTVSTTADSPTETDTSATAPAVEQPTSVINLLRGYDARGNLAWESIPRTTGEANGNPMAIGHRTEFTYDGLDRLLTRTEADGAKTENVYVSSTFVSSGATPAAHPGIRVRDAHCFDDSTVGTRCGMSYGYSDAHGNVVRQVRNDSAGTDVGLAAGDRVTSFGFDGLDRLISVVDPIGATWAYTYNGWGDRTKTVDPGLGEWDLTYDANHNLKTQEDAKSQLITFAYDALNRVTSKVVTATDSWSATYFIYGLPGANPAGYFNVGREIRQYVKTGAAAPGVAVHDVRRDYTAHGKVARETHLLNGRSYELAYSYAPDGSLLTQTLPLGVYPAAGSTIGPFTYDAASRVTGMQDYISSITYHPRWGQPWEETFANGVVVDYAYDPLRGWLNSVKGRKGTKVNRFAAIYTRSATGRIKTYDTQLESDTVDNAGSYTYGYDASGRLLSAVALYPDQTAYNQVMTYDAAGRIRSKGTSTATDLTYTYSGNKHAPSQVGSAALAYDANGNMTTATDGREIAYDAENRPVSVVKAGVKTCYVYGVDGARLKKITGLAANQNCATVPATAAQTVYFGPIEIENFKLVGSEKVVAFPHPSVKLVNGAAAANANYLHRDHLGSVRAITGPTGARVEATVYKPYGERTALSPTDTSNLTVAPEDREDKGWIGERFDPETGLQYLNARYYDPDLGMFTQPDWFEVTKPGVGTNRYAYSFGDPVNKLDPGGNSTEWSGTGDYNAINGTAAHNGPLARETSRIGYKSETGIFVRPGAKNGGLFGLIGEMVGITNGVPDGLRQTGPTSAEFFDYKPVTHNQPRSIRNTLDRAQQAGWIAQGAANGVSLTPVSKEELAKSFPPQGGKHVGSIVGITGETYDVTVYASTHTDGLAYYSLEKTDRTEPNGVAKGVRSLEGFLSDLGNAIQERSESGTVMPMPLPGPGRGLVFP